MVINEQIRRYNEKMEEIEQLEYAEALAVNQLKLKRQNTVRHQTLPALNGLCFDLVWSQYRGKNIKQVLDCCSALCLDVKEKNVII